MDLVTELTRALALVRPVGLSDDAASDWIAAAAAELQGLPEHRIVEGLAEARQSCSHHGQIVPTVLKAHRRAQAEIDGFVRQMDAISGHPLRPRQGQISADAKANELIANAANTMKA